MVAVTETTPGALPSINQKADVQVVPSGAEDNWVDAGDMNVLGSHVVAVARAVRFNALIAFITGAAETINFKGFRFTKKDSVSGLPEATATLTTDLNKVWAAAMETLEQGGDEDGTAPDTAGFGVGTGLLSGPVDTFTLDTLYAFSSDGTLKTYAGGKLPPVAIGVSPTAAMFDAGGRVMADNAQIEFNLSGALKLKTGLTHTFGTGTFEGALTAKTTYATQALSPAQITSEEDDFNPGDSSFWRLTSDASQNITGIIAGANGEHLRIANVGSFDIVLKHQDVGSSAANRILSVTGADLTISSDEIAVLMYDSTTQRWRAYKANLNGGAATTTRAMSLFIGSAVFPDDSTDNDAPGIEVVKSSGAVPNPFFLQIVYDPATDEMVMWGGRRLPPDYVGTPEGKVQLKMASATSGSVVLDMRVFAVTPGDATSLNAAVFDAINTTTKAVAGTVGHMVEATIALANDDGMVAGDYVIFYLRRDADNAADDASPASDMEIIAVDLEYQGN